MLLAVQAWLSVVAATRACMHACVEKALHNPRAHTHTHIHGVTTTSVFDQLLPDSTSHIYIYKHIQYNCIRL